MPIMRQRATAIMSSPSQSSTSTSTLQSTSTSSSSLPLTSTSSSGEDHHRYGQPKGTNHHRELSGKKNTSRASQQQQQPQSQSQSTRGRRPPATAATTATTTTKLFLVVLGSVVMVKFVGIQIVRRMMMMMTMTTGRRDGPPSSFALKAHRPKTPVPAANRRTFYCPGDKKINFPIIRAFRHHGWTKVNRMEDAQFIYEYRQRPDLFGLAVKTTQRKKKNNAVRLRPWQRYNHMPGFSKWNDKNTFVEGFNRYQAIHPTKDFYFLPDTFQLSVESERERFRQVLYDEGGLEHPWVLKDPYINQGRGITMLGPNSKELRDVLGMYDELNPSPNRDGIMNNNNNNDNSNHDDENDENNNDGTKDGTHKKKEDVDSEEDEEWEELLDRDFIVQRYICNEMVWEGNRKFDVRMFWLLASTDPLLVLYHDGYVRVGNAVYDETDFRNQEAHRTTHTGLAEELKTTWKALEDHVRDHYRRHESRLSRHIASRDPVSHVRNQFKEALAETVAAFKDVTFGGGRSADVPYESGYGFFGADFVLDNDLDAWLLEPQFGCGLDEDYDHRVSMHDELFRGMVAIEEEIWSKQDGGRGPDGDDGGDGATNVNLLPLRNAGSWQIIYADGWQYKYDDYRHPPDGKAGCHLHPDHHDKRQSPEEALAVSAAAAKADREGGGADEHDHIDWKRP